MAMMDLQVITTTMLSMVMWLGLFGGDDAAAARRLARLSNEAAAEAVRAHPDRFGGLLACRCPT